MILRFVNPHTLFEATSLALPWQLQLEARDSWFYDQKAYGKAPYNVLWYNPFWESILPQWHDIVQEQNHPSSILAISLAHAGQGSRVRCQRR